MRAESDILGPAAERPKQHRGRYLLPLACALLGACTNPAPQLSTARARGGQCFLPSQVNGFNAHDRDTVFVTLGVRTVYELEILGTCPDIDWSQRIGIRSRGGSSWVCHGYDAELLVPGPTGIDRCPVTAIRRLSEEEVRAYRQSRGR
ncbi:MAG: DUF6491 family protein [Pseudomonadota bacterium]|nr:DUF6491 family protein [Pseudomonadota bacterium]